MSWGRPEQEPKSVRDLADQQVNRTPRPAYEPPTRTTDDQEDDQ